MNFTRQACDEPPL